MSDEEHERRLAEMSRDPLVPILHALLFEGFRSRYGDAPAEWVWSDDVLPGVTQLWGIPIVRSPYEHIGIRRSYGEPTGRWLLGPSGVWRE